MGFRFTLLPVLEHRLTVEEEMQREYGEALAQLDALRRRRHEIEADMTRCIHEVRRKQKSGILFAARELYDRWIQAQQERSEQLRIEAEQAAKVAEERRLKLLKAVQDRTVMEKLRDTELEAYRQEEARAELRMFDEIAVRDYVNTRRQEKDAASPERIAR